MEKHEDFIPDTSDPLIVAMYTHRRKVAESFVTLGKVEHFDCARCACRFSSAETRREHFRRVHYKINLKSPEFLKNNTLLVYTSILEKFQGESKRVQKKAARCLYAILLDERKENAIWPRLSSLPPYERKIWDELHKMREPPRVREIKDSSVSKHDRKPPKPKQNRRESHVEGLRDPAGLDPLAKQVADDGRRKGEIPQPDEEIVESSAPLDLILEECLSEFHGSELSTYNPSRLQRAILALEEGWMTCLPMTREYLSEANDIMDVAYSFLHELNVQLGWEEPISILRLLVTNTETLLITDAGATVLSTVWKDRSLTGEFASRSVTKKEISKSIIITADCPRFLRMMHLIHLTMRLLREEERISGTTEPQ